MALTGENHCSPFLTGPPRKNIRKRQDIEGGEMNDRLIGGHFVECAKLAGRPSSTARETDAVLRRRRTGQLAVGSRHKGAKTGVRRARGAAARRRTRRVGRLPSTGAQGQCVSGRRARWRDTAPLAPSRPSQRRRRTARALAPLNNRLVRNGAVQQRAARGRPPAARHVEEKWKPRGPPAYIAAWLWCLHNCTRSLVCYGLHACSF